MHTKRDWGYYGDWHSGAGEACKICGYKIYAEELCCGWCEKHTPLPEESPDYADEDLKS